MTHELLPLIKAGTEPRIINLSSAAQSPVTQDFLSGKSTPGDNEAYAQSKLAILLWSFHLAKTEPSISTVALNPGSLLNTNMVREAYGRFWSPAEKGGDIIYELTQNDLHPDASGKYFDNDKGTYGLAHPDAYNPDIINSVISNTKSVLERL
jgi:NAD(P)-dependent dehydrogenase (short-subunit alcohol dehydrogenase family)